MRQLNSTFILLNTITGTLGFILLIFSILKAKINNKENTPLHKKDQSSFKLLTIILLVVSCQVFLGNLLGKGLYNQSTLKNLGWMILVFITPLLFYLYYRLKINGPLKKKILVVHFSVFLLLLVGLTFFKVSPFNDFLNKGYSSRMIKQLDRSRHFRRGKPNFFRDRSRFLSSGGQPNSANPSREERFNKRRVFQKQLINLFTSKVLNLQLFILTGTQIDFSNFLISPGLYRNQNKNSNILIFSLFFYAYQWFYFILILNCLIKYFKTISLKNVSSEKYNIVWLLILALTIGLILLIKTILLILSSYSNVSIMSLWINRIIPTSLFYVSLIGVFYLFFHPRINQEELKYGKNTLGDEKIQIYNNRLIEYIKVNEPYLNETITLSNMAQELSIPSNDLSQLINKKYSCNFNDFINIYRVKRVKKELKKPENSFKKMIAIAYDSGFNSKSSFNYTFKKHTDMTPTQYLKSIKNH